MWAAGILLSLVIVVIERYKPHNKIQGRVSGPSRQDAPYPETWTHTEEHQEIMTTSQHIVAPDNVAKLFGTHDEIIKIDE